MGLYKLERYSHEGYLIKVVVMALAGEVARELSPIMRSKASGKGKGMGWSREANVSDTPFETTGPARKRYFSLPVSSHESVNTHGRITIFLQFVYPSADMSTIN
jgi:hypothetical protein